MLPRERGEQVKGTQGLSVLLFITIPHKSITISKQTLKSPLACPNIVILKINYLKKELVVILTNTFVCILSLSLQSTESL